MVPSARRQQAEQFVAEVIGVFDDPVGFLPVSLGVKALHGWLLCPGDVLCSFHYEGGATAIRSGDAASQDTLNGAPEKVAEYPRVYVESL